MTIAPTTAARRNRTLDDALLEARETYVARRPKSKAQHEAARANYRSLALELERLGAQMAIKDKPNSKPGKLSKSGQPQK